MEPEKPFDCVEMKNDVQARMAEDYAGLTDEQRRARLADELSAGDDPVSRKWREAFRRRFESARHPAA